MYLDLAQGRPIDRLFLKTSCRWANAGLTEKGSGACSHIRPFDRPFLLLSILLLEQMSKPLSVLTDQAGHLDQSIKKSMKVHFDTTTGTPGRQPHTISLFDAKYILENDVLSAEDRSRFRGG